MNTIGTDLSSLITKKTTNSPDQYGQTSFSCTEDVSDIAARLLQ